MDVKREWFDKDYYALLGVASSAPEKEIQQAYRKLARELHPDANPGDNAAEERFKEISAAYDVIGDPETRSHYDEARRMGPAAMGGGSFGGGGPGGFNFDDGDMGDLNDLLGGMFGGGQFGGRGGPRPQTRPDHEPRRRRTVE
jgi:molecular chaperone DnaJ